MFVLIPQGPGGPGVRDSDVPESTVIKIPGDTLALSVGFRELVTETLDEQCLSLVNPRLELLKWDELSNRFLCDCRRFVPSMDYVWVGLSAVEPVFVFVLRWMACCQPGASASYCVAQGLLGTGGNRVLTNFLQGCVPVLYQDFAPKLDMNLIYRLLDLVNCFELSWGIGGHNVSSQVYLTGAYYHQPR